MALTRPFPVDQAYPNASDLRREFTALVPHEGLVPDPTTIGDAVAYAGSGWTFNARPFVAVIRRGGASFGLTYGSVLVANDAIQTGAWTIPAAPATGSRIDLLWIEAVDPSQGGTTTTPSGETVPRAVPRFGVTSGTAATTPTAPAAPAGVLVVSQVTTASTATSAAQSNAQAAYRYANTAGSTVIQRSKAWLDGVPAPTGTLGLTLDDGITYQRTSSGTWVPVASPWIDYATTWSASVAAPTIGNGTLVARYRYTGRNTIQVMIDLLFGSSTSGGRGSFGFTLPSGMVAAGGGRKIGEVMVELSGFAYHQGVAQIAPGGTTIAPFVSLSNSSPALGIAQNADSSGGSGTSIPVRPSAYAYASGSRITIEAEFELAA